MGTHHSRYYLSLSNVVKLLDYTFVYEFNQSPQMALADAQAPLPCSQEAWERSSLDTSTQFEASTYNFRYT